MELRDFQRETARLLVNFRALADLSAEIASAHDFTTTVRASLLMVLGALSATRGALLMLNASTSRLEVCVVRGVQVDVEAELPLSEADAAELIRFGTAFSLEEPLEPLQVLASEMGRHLPGMLVAAPLVVREQVLGILAVGAKLTRQPYSEGELELFSMLAMMLASGIYSHRLIQGLQEANRALRETQEQLIRAERLATIGQLSAGIAHEVKNPLTSILGFAGTIQSEADSLTPDQVREYASIVVDESRRLQSIIDEVRQYSKPKGYTMEPAPLAEVVDEIVSFTRFDALFRQVEIRREFHGNPIVRLNRDKIKQVLLNLLRNAAQAISDPSRGLIRVVVEEEPEFGVVRIVDNGSGMPPETLSQIFQPFFTTKGDEGTGLGLDICRQIIEQGHGGQIWPESEVGVGTSFSIRLPLASAAALHAPRITEGVP
jgi:signal transduction histidine kinase